MTLTMTARMNPETGSPHFRYGFTLIEVLAVVVIMILIMSFVIPAITGIKSASDITRAAYDVSGTIEQARAYALANNTYVWVGFAEVDQSLGATVVPQKSGIGRLAISVIASKDGTKIYDETATDLASDWTTKTAGGAGLMQLGKLLRLENIHLAASLGVPPSVGKMARPAVDNNYLLGNAGCAPVLTFAYPLGKGTADALYSFAKVIQFDPQGTAKVVMQANYDTIIEWMEVGLQPTKGNLTPTVPSDPNVGNHVAIQLEGLTGAVKMFRP